MLAPPATSVKGNPEEVTYLLDISNHQGFDVNFERIYAEGFRAVIFKASQGDYFRDATYKQNVRRARAAGLIVGAYHYLEHGNIQAQINLFLEMIGGVKAAEGLILAVDVELSGWGNDCDVHDVWNFVIGLKERLNNSHPILIYSGAWYWKNPTWMKANNPDVGSLVRGYDAHLWLSEYVHPDLLPSPPFAYSIYKKVPEVWWEEAFGNHPPRILQFTDRALVAGKRLDANACKDTLAFLKSLATGKPAPKPAPKPTPEEPEEVDGKSRIVIPGLTRVKAERSVELIRKAQIFSKDQRISILPREEGEGKPEQPKEDQTLDALEKITKFGNAILGAFYATWELGQDENGPPIYFDKKPSSAFIKKNGTICSGWIVLVMHLLGADLSRLKIPGILPGGTLSMSDAWGRQKWGNLEEYVPGKSYPALTLFGTPYEGDIDRSGVVEVDEQGHVAFSREKGSNPRLWQSLPVGGVQKELRLKETFRPRYVVRPYGKGGWLEKAA